MTQQTAGGGGVPSGAAGGVLGGTYPSPTLANGSALLPYAQLGRQVAGGTVASLTVSAIPATYNVLFITYVARTSIAAVNDYIAVRFNGDTGTNYSNVHPTFNDTAAGFGGNFSLDRMILGLVTGSTATAAYAGAGQILVPEYAATTFNKVATASIAYAATNATGGIAHSPGAGIWLSTAAVTSVTLIANTGSLLIGSTLTVYGLL